MARQSTRASERMLFAYLGKAANILEQLGYDYLPTDHNPVWLALAGLNPVTQEQVDWMVDNEEMTGEEAEQLMSAAAEGKTLADKLTIWKGKTADKGAILKAYALCQTACLNSIGGPLRDSSLVSLRQRWYFSKESRFMGFKMASQLLEQYCVRSADIVLVDDERAYSRAMDMGAKRVEYKPQFKKKAEERLKAELNRQPRVHIWPKGGWGRTYAQAQSSILADLVRDGLTYEQLWMRDSSKYVSKQTPLVDGLHGALLIEKEKLYDAFQPFARALGFSSFVAMGGNNAFSTVEAVLNEHYRDYDGKLVIDQENPLHLFVISDWDYFGLVPVQQGAVAQFERYLGNNVVVHRVGIDPDMVSSYARSPFQAGYEIEQPDANTATWEWYDQYGIWMGEKWAAGSVCKGIEIEALDPSQYIPFLIDAVVEAAGGDDELRLKLARLAEPDWYYVAQSVVDTVSDMSRMKSLLSAITRWVSDQERERITGPISTFAQTLIEKGTKFRCPHCESELGNVPAICPSCGADLESDSYWIASRGTEPWKESDSVRDAVAEIISEKAEGINLDRMHYNAENNLGVFRPVSSGDATEVAATLFVDEHIYELMGIVGEADDSLLIWFLEGVCQELEPFGLEFPAGEVIDPNEHIWEWR